ncbi:MAG: DUF5615 family PIN-like protein [Candidatus Nanohaloarchaea archaeon]|nr:DUF5615 family PIN-like protein [Candidatus Nanohaloarchaea archaeon]
MRFFADEHIRPGVVEGLRRRGHSVLTVEESDRRSVPDRNHLTYAREEGLVILTADQDFLRLAMEREEHPGIIFLTSPELPVRLVLRRIGEIADMLSSGEMENHIEFVS